MFGSNVMGQLGRRRPMGLASQFGQMTTGFQEGPENTPVPPSLISPGATGPSMLLDNGSPDVPSAPTRRGGMAFAGPPGGRRDLSSIIGPAPEKPSNKLKFADIAMILAAGLAGAGGNPYVGQFVGSNFARRREERNKQYQAAQSRFQNASTVAALPGMTERELVTYLNSPEAWAKANATRFEAATLDEKDTRVFGDPNNGGSFYQPPRLIQNGVDTVRVDPAGRVAPETLYTGLTDGEQYARSLDLEPGDEGYTGALQDEKLRGDGPTAFGFDADLERMRYGNRASLEEQRQENRLSLRRTPPARAPGAGPRTGKPATGSGGRIAVNPKTGERVQWNGTAWVPLR